MSENYEINLVNLKKMGYEIFLDGDRGVFIVELHSFEKSWGVRYVVDIDMLNRKDCILFVVTSINNLVREVDIFE